MSYKISWNMSPIESKLEFREEKEEGCHLTKKGVWVGTELMDFKDALDIIQKL